MDPLPEDRPRLFVTRKGRQDILNPEDGSHWSYYVTHWLQVVYALAFIALCAFLTSADVPHTHFQPGVPSNALYSERYTSLWWISLCFAATRFWFFVVMMSMWLYRNTLCCGGGRYAGCTIFWMALLFVLVGLEVLTLGMNTQFMVQANTQHAVGNPANSPLWCCLPEVYIHDENHCPNSAACPSLPEPIVRDPTVVGLFSFSLVFLALDAYFIGVPILLWFWQRVPRRESLPESGADLDETAEAGLMDVGASVVVPSAPPAHPIDLKRRAVPQTPLLAAASTNGPIVHVTPFGSTEKDTKQP